MDASIADLFQHLFGTAEETETKSVTYRVPEGFAPAMATLVIFLAFQYRNFLVKDWNIHKNEKTS